jgi:hypothetical protein
MEEAVPGWVRAGGGWPGGEHELPPSSALLAGGRARLPRPQSEGGGSRYPSSLAPSIDVGGGSSPSSPAPSIRWRSSSI